MPVNGPVSPLAGAHSVLRPLPLDAVNLTGTGQQAGPVGDAITVTAVPYYRWGNRAPGGMRVWIPTS